MADWTVLHQTRPSLNRTRVGAPGHRQTDFHIHAQCRPDFHVLRVLSEARGRHRHVIRIKWHIREGELPLAVRGGRPVKSADRVVNLDARIGHHRARRVHYRAADRTSARLRVSVKAQYQTENHYKSRMKRLLVRRQHEFLQKNWSKRSRTRFTNTNRPI